jgi:hypothetical protein
MLIHNRSSELGRLGSSSPPYDNNKRSSSEERGTSWIFLLAIINNQPVLPRTSLYLLEHLARRKYIVILHSHHRRHSFFFNLSTCVEPWRLYGRCNKSRSQGCTCQQQRSYRAPNTPGKDDQCHHRQSAIWQRLWDHRNVSKSFATLLHQVRLSFPLPHDTGHVR